MEEEIIYCENCGWAGYHSMLKAPDNDNGCHECPDCENYEYLGEGEARLEYHSLFNEKIIAIKHKNSNETFKYFCATKENKQKFNIK